MKSLRNPSLRGMLPALLLGVALVGLVTRGSLLHAASLPQLLRGLGLTDIPDTPAAAAFRLPDLEGRMVSLQDHRGKVIMLYFWTTW